MSNVFSLHSVTVFITVITGGPPSTADPVREVALHLGGEKRGGCLARVGCLLGHKGGVSVQGGN